VDDVSGVAAMRALGHAFLWDNGWMRDLGTLPGYDYSMALGINNAGRVVGYSFTATTQSLPTPSRACLWDNGTMSDLGTLPEANDSEAFGLNDRGAVVGDSGNDSLDGHGVLWQAGNVTDLGDLGRPGTSAHAINDAGQVVGGSHNFESHVHAFLWEVGTFSVRLPSGASRELSFVWNTSGVAPGSYLVVMETAPLAGETDLGDNVFAAGTLTIAPRPVFAEASATPLATDVEIRVSFT